MTIVTLRYSKLSMRLNAWKRLCEPETQFTPPIFTCATHLHGTVQILLQISVMSAVENLAQFRGFRVNKRRILASFCPFKNLSGLL